MKLVKTMQKQCRGCFSGPVIFLLYFSSFAHAQVTVSLPLDGYCRPGHYMPVQISRVAKGPPSAQVILHAEGAIDTVIAMSNTHPQVTVPWLVVNPPLHNARWNLGNVSREIELPLRLLEENDRLVGYTTDSPAVAAKLFPGKTIIPIHLDPASPITGDAAAWECMDALVLDVPAAQRVSSAQRDVLMAAGTALVIESKTLPDQQWNWQRDGDIWVLRSFMEPSAGLIEESAYLPVENWNPGWPAFLRKKIVLSAVAFSLLVLGALLLRHRWSTALVLLLVILSLGSTLLWLARQSPVAQVSGSVMVQNAHNATIDRWTYQTSMRSADATVSWRDLIHPVFFSENHWRQMQMHLECGPDGQPSAFVYHLLPDTRQAFVSRRSGHNGRWWNSLQPASSPMMEMVRRMYLAPGSQILGQTPDKNDWPMVLIQTH